MAEVGLIASVVQLAATGLKLSISLYTFAKTVSEADKNIKSIAREVSLTSAVLGELGSILKQDGQQHIASDTAFATADEIVRECSNVFTDLEFTLQKGIQKSCGGKLGNVGKLALEKLKWPYRQPRIELLQKNLERLKSTLILMLQVLTYARKVSIEKHTKEPPSRYDWQQIESLIAANNEAVKQFNESKSRLQTSEKRLALDDAATDTSERSVPPSYVTEAEENNHTLREFQAGPNKATSVSSDPEGSPFVASNMTSWYAATPRVTSPETRDLASEPRQQGNSGSIQVMSGMDPAALVNHLTLSGLLVNRIQDARSTLTAANLVKDRVVSSEVLPPGSRLRSDSSFPVIKPIVTRTQDTVARREHSPRRRPFRDQGAKRQNFELKRLKLETIRPSEVSQLSAYENSLFRARSVWSFSRTPYPSHVKGLSARSSTEEFSDHMRPVPSGPRYELAFLLQFQKICKKAPSVMILPSYGTPAKRVSGHEPIKVKMTSLEHSKQPDRRVIKTNCAASVKPLSSSPSIKRSNLSSRWTVAEDERLLHARTQDVDWKQIPIGYLPNRSTYACVKRHRELMENQAEMEKAQKYARSLRRSHGEEFDEPQPEFCVVDNEGEGQIESHSYGSKFVDDEYLKPEAQATSDDIRKYRTQGTPAGPREAGYETYDMNLELTDTEDLDLALGEDSIDETNVPNSKVQQATSEVLSLTDGVVVTLEKLSSGDSPERDQTPQYRKVSRAAMRASDYQRKCNEADRLSAVVNEAARLGKLSGELSSSDLVSPVTESRQPVVKDEPEPISSTSQAKSKKRADALAQFLNDPNMGVWADEMEEAPAIPQRQSSEAVPEPTIDPVSQLLASWTTITIPAI